MTRKLPPVDVVLVGFGWTGAILAQELTDEGHFRSDKKFPFDVVSLLFLFKQFNYLLRNTLMIKLQHCLFTIAM